MPETPEIQDFLNRKRSKQRASAFKTTLIIFLVSLGFIPFKFGSVLFVLSLLNFSLISFSSLNRELDHYFVNIASSLFPIATAIVYPTELMVARIATLTAGVVSITDSRSDLARAIWAMLSLCSWIFIAVFKDNFQLDECTSQSLEKNTFSLLVGGGVSLGLILAEKNAKTKLINKTLADLQELNSKYEEANNTLKEMLNEKDGFILLFSHETRNPLNILMGNLAILLEEVNDSSIKTKLLRCKFCAELLLHQLNNILDTGKLTNTGNLEIVPIETKTYEYIQSTANFMETLVKKKGLKPELLVTSKLPSLLRFDHQRLTQVVLNMLTNAVKFTNTGSITLSFSYLGKESLEEADFKPELVFAAELIAKPLSSRASVAEFEENILEKSEYYSKELKRSLLTHRGMKEEDCQENEGEQMEKKGFLKIEICDSGCGIKPEDIEKLFQKFMQVNSERSQRQIGTGLGLWISKTLCVLMGGDIKVYSKLGVGTCFIVIVQADSVPLSVSPRCSTLPARDSTSRTSRSRRILLADSDPYNVELLSQMLKGLGNYEIETVSDGEKLVSLFSSRPEGYFESIITDVRMPLVDGLEAAKMIRCYEKNEKRTRRVKIGFVAGDIVHQDKIISQSEPINAWFYLCKPVKMDILESFFVHPREPRGSTRSAVKENLEDMLTNKPTVLCVDDDFFNLECLQELLETLGARVILSNSAAQAIEIVESNHLRNKQEINLIFMDCRMPDVDGWEASKRIKEMLRQKNSSDIPIVGLTGERKDANKEKFIDSGMSDLLQKPITKGQLRRILKENRNSN